MSCSRDLESFSTKMPLPLLWTLLWTGMPCRKNQRAMRQKNPIKKASSRTEKSPQRMETEPPETVFSLTGTIRSK